ncbi:ankyrin repeat domain-containing protein [Skeletonema marinoi]|uniref:Ankyrin repeat domain-containing protein n=1 Tax=Skeletonema marinoi TaxID=267567 RepID=A0AAD8XUT9_9STRA|nr:ankyrin repeat domain-containing protein [Skeletonema marinoi]
MSEISNNSRGANELRSYCASEFLSEDGLRQIFERHTYPHVNNYYFFLEACINERVDEGIIQCLLEYFPAAVSANYLGQTPLHLNFACGNKNMTLNIIQLLIDAAPDSVRSVTNRGRMPLHNLCMNKILDKAAALEILTLLIEKCPEAIRHANNNGDLPIHIAAKTSKSTEFFRMLIEAYPGSERITDPAGNLPLHYACADNTLATVEYLHKLYPDAINHTTTDGYHPIHYAIVGVFKKRKSFSPSDSVDIVKFLLDCDPKVTLQKGEGKSPLHYACFWDYNDSTIEAALEMIKAIYDAYPEAIEDNAIVSTIERYHQRVQAFINSELVYSRKAKDHRLMTTPDGNGRLPLHTALQHNVRLGSIKLLVKGNPSAIRNSDTNFAMPLHLASQHHNSSNVVQYLVGLDTSTLDAVDKEGGTALHYACRGAKYDTIALLLEKYDAVSVSKRNAKGKLPIDLLWESNEVEDRGSIEYTEGVFRLLKAYPEMVMVMNIDMQQQQQSAAASCPSQNGKKRKFGNEE